MAVEVRATSRDGTPVTLQGQPGQPLMEVLRESDLEVEGTCGGACACGTCHVYVGAAWLDKLPPKSDDEQMMIDAIAELVDVTPESRLSCQIPLKEELQGIEVKIGPVP